MSSYISDRLRKDVAKRANFRCEYCKMPQLPIQLKHEPDHILPRKHGGENVLKNLAFACFGCNRHKGTDIASYDDLTGNLTAFYNPRTQIWAEHFQMQNAEIIPLTPEARVVVKILQINGTERIEQRQILIELGIF
ncbi:MAG TPA: HNH endonuclease signature motif containing protein [Pyrinomonadaceae bacterium]|nr:HNH endonuclease signature motif containing protein [Pyrinomonadaceae bacterium]